MTENVRPNLVDPRKVRADDLRYLLALARTGRLTAAAVVLGVDHTTVSRRISALEKIIGVRLVERGADGWELTEIGRSVAESARPIEEAIENVTQAASGETTQSIRGTVRVTAPDGFGAVVVAPALTKLQRKHPQLGVELITATRELTLHQSGFDIAIAVGVQGGTRLLIEDLASTALSLYATKEYLAENGSPETIKDLQHHRLISYTPSLLQVDALDYKRELPELATGFSSTNIFAQLEATRAGGGIGVLPDFMASRYTDLIELGHLELNKRADFIIAARRESFSRPVVRLIREALHDAVNRWPGELRPVGRRTR